MKELFFKEFKTAWGIAVIIFNKKNIRQIILPGRNNKIPFEYTLYSGKTDWLCPIQKKITDYFNGKKVKFGLTHIDLDGYTDFEKKVYRTLCRIQYGRTISYSRLAIMAGYPRAFRAVGRAMAKNRTPLFIPCHRVIKAEGDIGEFSYGRDYKSRMLKLEKRPK